MKKIDIFDTEAKRIEKLCGKHDVADASVIEALFDALGENDIDIRDYLGEEVSTPSKVTITMDVDGHSGYVTNFYISSQNQALEVIESHHKQQSSVDETMQRIVEFIVEHIFEDED